MSGNPYSLRAGLLSQAESILSHRYHSEYERIRYLCDRDLLDMTTVTWPTMPTSEEIIAEAEKHSNILKGEGEAARNQILNEAFAKDPEFFEFIRSMEAYADTFKDGTTTMVISPDSDFFEYFENSEGAN